MYKGQCALYAASAFATTSFNSNTATVNRNTALHYVKFVHPVASCQSKLT